jgi:hypothetical protein
MLQEKELISARFSGVKIKLFVNNITEAFKKIANN